VIINELDNNAFKHFYIVDKFSMEARLKLNKVPTLNKRPQLSLAVLLGGRFKDMQTDE